MADSAPPPAPPLDRARAKIREIDDTVSSARQFPAGQDALSKSLHCVELLTDVSYILWKELQLKSGSHIEDDIKSYELYREYIIHEDNLRNARTASLLTIQGFLFAAIGASTTASATGKIYALQFLISIIGFSVTCIHRIRYIQQNAVYTALELSFRRIDLSEKFKNRYPQYLRYSGVDRKRKIAEFVNYHHLFMIVWILVLLYLLVYEKPEVESTLIHW